MDNLIERGYSLSEIKEMGFDLPEFNVVTRMKLVGVTVGKNRYERAKMDDAGRGK